MLSYLNKIKMFSVCLIIIYKIPTRKKLSSRNIYAQILTLLLPPEIYSHEKIKLKHT